MLKLFFKTPGASNPSSHTRTDSTDHNYPKSFTKLVAGTATIFTLGKRSEDLTTGKRNISRPFWNMITLLQLLITLKQLATTSNGTILTFWHPARLTTTVKLRRPCYRVTASIECQCQQWRAFTLLRKPFHCPFTDSFCLKRLKFLLCGSRKYPYPPPRRVTEFPRGRRV